MLAIATLPSEITLHIMAYLDWQSLIRASKVCREWHELSRDSHLWRAHCIAARIPVLPSSADDVDTCGSRKSSDNVRSEQPGIDWCQAYQTLWSLDQNWRTGTSTQFQLPSRDHPLEGHTDAVYAIQLTGNYLVSGSWDRTIRIWDVQTSRLVGRPLSGHLSGVLCLQVDARKTGNIIVSGSADGEIIAWNFSTANMIKRAPCAHGDAVLSVKFNKRFVVTGSMDRTIRAWDLRSLCKESDDLEDASLKPFQTLSGHEGGVNAIDILGDSLVSASGDNTIKVWSISHGTCLKTVVEPGSMACVRFDGETIVWGGRHSSVGIYDHDLKPICDRLCGHKNLVRAVRSRIGSGFTDIVVSGSYDGRLVIWTRRAGQEWHSRALRPTSCPTCVAGSDGVAGADCSSAKFRSQHTILGERFPPSACVAVQGARQRPRVVAAQKVNTKSSSAIDTRVPRIFGVDFDDQRLACCSDNRTIYGWDFANNDSDIDGMVRGVSERLAAISLSTGI